MRTTGGVLVLFGALFSLYSGSCSLLGAGASSLGGSAVAGVTDLVSRELGPAATRPAAPERQPGRTARPPSRERARRVLRQVREVSSELAASTNLLLAAGVTSLVGGVLAFLAGTLLAVNVARGFVVLSLLLALTGAGLTLLTPLSSVPFAAAKGATLGIGLLVALFARRERPPAGGLGLGTRRDAMDR